MTAASPHATAAGSDPSRTRLTEDAAFAALREALKVHEGRDGWLFLVGGPNRPLDSYRRSPRWWWILHRWARLIRARQRRARRLGIRFVQVVVPEKLSVLGREAPDLDIDLRLAPVRRLSRALVGCGAYLDLVPALAPRESGPPLYLRTDTHWSDDGCHAAYRALCRDLGAEPIDLARYPADEDAFSGDLGVKLRPPRIETRRLFRFGRDATRHYASPLVTQHEADPSGFALHRGAHVGFRNGSTAADQRRLLLFGDSFAGYEPRHLTGMLAETFAETHFVWSSSIDWALVERLRPDILVAEIAERFLFRPADDRFDIDAFATARLMR